MPLHVGRHYQGTSCLCTCHFVSGSCDNRKCIAWGKSERATLVAAQEVVPQAPVSAQAADHSVGYRTPFGLTTRFTS